jgi:hypothetical protein
MAITYTWTITQLDCYPSYAGQADVVFMVYWTYTGTEGSASFALSGSVNCRYIAGSPFTPYNQLTQDQVIGWVTEALGPSQISTYQGIIANQIGLQLGPTPVTPPLPWVK